MLIGTVVWDYGDITHIFSNGESYYVDEVEEGYNMKCRKSAIIRQIKSGEAVVLELAEELEL